MKLIESVEINYFRSVYSVKLKKIQDLNILVGGNDSGKSNILRALNLFFNGKPSPNEELDFLEDVSHIRQDEARDAKGRLTIWIKITFNNVEKWRVLPNQFSIKKVWNRYSKDSELSFDDSIKQVNITKFLNKINFHYVPAIKHSDTYSYYLRKLHETIALDPQIDLGAPASALSRSINSAVTELAEQVERKIGITSRINVPTDFGTLFERLYFETVNGEYNIPLSKRGDGIQARHIPHILEYISSKNKKLNIWAYEEPENSLEMSNSFDLADQFSDVFSRQNQIFLTSHSPAFYGLDGDNLQKYFVQKTDEDERTDITSASPFGKVDLPDTHLGIAALVADRSAELFRSIEQQKEKISELERINRPVLITEGITDVRIFEEAQKRIFGNEERYQVIACDPSPDVSGGHSKLKALLEAIPHSEQQVRIGVFDRDKAGIGSFTKLSSFEAIDGEPDYKKRKHGNVYACLLPDVDWDYEFFDLSGRPVAIEQLFSPTIIGEDIIDVSFETNSGNITKAKARQLVRTLGDEDTKTLVSCKIRIKDKNLASNRIVAANDEAYEPFRQLFENIDSIISR